MTAFILIPGAGSGPWYWHLTAGELRRRGHDVVPVDLPCEDDSAGLAEYAEAALDAIGDRENLVVVGHSFGGFTAPLLCERAPVEQLILLQAMVPAPGEAPGEWWANTGHEQARREQAESDGAATGAEDDLHATFYHDVPPDLAAEAMRTARDQSATPMARPWPLEAWPDVPTRFLLCGEDRFLPARFLRRVVRERLGITPDEIAAGHLPMLSRPYELADRLEAYAGVRPE